MTNPHTRLDSGSAYWRKSKRSENAGACAELAAFDKTIRIRDSQSAHKSMLIFTSQQWDNFIRHGKERGKFNL
jgi:hypothetical protein